MINFAKNNQNSSNFTDSSETWVFCMNYVLKEFSTKIHVHLRFCMSYAMSAWNCNKNRIVNMNVIWINGMRLILFIAGCHKMCMIMNCRLRIFSVFLSIYYCYVWQSWCIFVPILLYFHFVLFSLLVFVSTTFINLLRL